MLKIFCIFLVNIIILNKNILINNINYYKKVNYLLLYFQFS